MPTPRMPPVGRGKLSHLCFFLFFLSFLPRQPFASLGICSSETKSLLSELFGPEEWPFRSEPALSRHPPPPGGEPAPGPGVSPGLLYSDPTSPLFAIPGEPEPCGQSAGGGGSAAKWERVSGDPGASCFRGSGEMQAAPRPRAPLAPRKLSLFILSLRPRS